MKFLRKLGPGFLVTAAFIGPGTVTTASRAGADFGFTLLWTVLFAIAATVILQEMAARLGLVSRLGLGEAVRRTFRQRVVRVLACVFILLAIGFGNAAYQTGNLTGAAQGMQILFRQDSSWWIVLLLGALAFTLLFTGIYKLIEWVLIGLVALMSLLFVLTAILAGPSLVDIARGMFVPTMPENSLTTVIALIGTTVVPYNLFLHADSVREKWSVEVPLPQALSESRKDTAFSIAVGGIITAAIITTAAATFFNKSAAFTKLSDVPGQLEPLVGGSTATVAFALGLFAAGLTSAITAPLAAAYAVSGVLGWEKGLHSWRFRLVWMVILVTGVVFAIVYGHSPAETIIVAQVANGLLLPIIAIFLLIVVNHSDLLGSYRNRIITNLLGGLVVLIASGLGVWKIIEQMMKAKWFGG